MRNARSFVSLAGLAGLIGVLPAAAAPDAPASASARGQGNRIEVTGNRADGDSRARCGERRADGGTSNVNSVNIRGAALSGKTVIVTGGNPADCPAPAPGAAPGAGGSNVNSVNIR